MKNYIKEFMKDNDLKFDEEFLTDITGDKRFKIKDNYILIEVDGNTDNCVLRWLLEGTQKVIKITPELLPCPFCGGKAKLDGAVNKVFWIRCNNKDCEVGCITCDFETKAEAIKAWNTRYVPQD